MVRGQLLPLLRLHRLFNVARTEDPTEALVVIVQDNDRRVCILVDELLGQEQVVIKSLGDGIDKVPGHIRRSGAGRWKRLARRTGPYRTGDHSRLVTI